MKKRNSKMPENNMQRTIIEPSTLKAHTVVDFRGTQYEKDFVVNGDVTAWAKKGSSENPPQDLTPAEALIHTMAGQFDYSRQADEYFKTLVETDPQRGFGIDYYGSAYAMLMNGHQNPHFHPDPSGAFPEASLRILTVIPFANTHETDSKGLKHTQGIEFSLFDLKNPYLPLEGEKEVKGTPISPQHKVHFPPGHIGTVVFNGGIHEFKGNGLIISDHPLDIGEANIGDTYDANSLVWKGDKDLEDQKQVTPAPYDFGSSQIGYRDLPELYAHFQREALGLLQRITTDHNPQNPVTLEEIDQYRANLRGHVMSPNGFN